MEVPLVIALADIGVWGLAAIAAGTVIVLRVADRARLVNPPKEQQQQPEEAKA